MESGFPKIRSIVQLYDLLPESERVITDVLRLLIKGNLPASCKEKISYNVPFFYGNKGICIIWPATVPGGELKKVFCWVFGMALRAILFMEQISRYSIRYFTPLKRSMRGRS